MTKKQTSATISTLAAKYVRIKDAQLNEISWQTLYRVIRKLAASCLSQDETNGQGK